MQGHRSLKVEAQRVFHSDRQRTIRLAGDVDQILEFETRFGWGGRVISNGKRIDPIFFRRNFDWAYWEFSLPELGPAHPLFLEVEELLGTILTFRCYLDKVLIYEDRDLGQEVVVGTQSALSDYPLAAQAPGNDAAMLPVAASEIPDGSAVER